MESPARSTAAAVAAALMAITVGTAAQLTERPLAGAPTHPAIGYFTRPTDDLVAELNHRIDAGAVNVTFEEGTGYLRSVLDALHVPVESQILVMSKTGVQALHTGPGNPRAIFFNDAVAVGYIRGAPLLEIAVHDPQQGVLFYTLDQQPRPRPLFERPPACLRCHQAYNTLHVPGLLLRSVPVAADGLPLSQFGSYDADDRTPFERRWGGWYVTGMQGSLRHMGNVSGSSSEKPEIAGTDGAQNRASLDGAFDAHGYLSAQSDIAALMVYQHQVHMTNLITRIGWESRIARDEHRLDLASGGLRQGIDELVDYLLFVDEQPLSVAVRGLSGFAEKFTAEGRADSRGHSLRQLDLNHRLLRYRCSYMIYSAAFGALPIDVRQAVYGRMWRVLSGNDTSPKYSRLAEADRQAIVEILRDTLHELPSEFNEAPLH